MTDTVVPYLDFSTQHNPLQTEFESAFKDITRTGQFILGPYVEAFERQFAEYCNTSECIAVNSGTSALHLALLATGVGPGDEVITTPSTFVATVAAITYTGAKPVLVDIDPQNFCINPAKISSVITANTKAIIPVHLYGLISDMTAINSIADEHGLAVIEDAAQAHGATQDGKRAGNHGDLAAFSFYPGKNLGAFGEGGAITTSNVEMAELIRSLRDWGQSGKGNHIHNAYNYRMDAIQGAVLNIKLMNLEDWTNQRQVIAQRYHGAFSGTPLKLQSVSQLDRPAWHVYSICHAERDNLRQHLLDNGIHTGIHYPQAVHQSPAYHSLGYGEGSFPVAEKLAAEELSLPIFPGMTDAQIDRVIVMVTDFFSA
jgi:dTDP-4-amino-4,6-dideoxygalactose transaminase